MFFGLPDVTWDNLVVSIENNLEIPPPPPLSFAPRYMLKCKTIIPNLITCGSNTISKLSCKNAPGMKLTCYNQAQTSTAGYPC